MRRFPVAIALAVTFAVLASACSSMNDQITVTAVFDDVQDLVTQAHVRAGDVPIGTVEQIELTDDNRALVTMEIESDTGLPTQTRAILSKTSLLGERFVELRPVGTEGSLADGQQIEDTTTVSDLEDLVGTGNDLLAFVSADRLSAMVETGAVAFGGRGGLIGRFLDSVNGFVGEIEGDKDVLLDLIDSLDGLTSDLAPAADTNAEALAVLEQASQALQEQDDRLLTALDDLTRLSTVGTRLMRNTRTETDAMIRRLRRVLHEINRIDGALQGLLTWLPSHNRHVPNGAINERAQVWLDFLICGFNDGPADDPSRACDPPNPNESTNPDDYPADPDAGREQQQDQQGGDGR